MQHLAKRHFLGEVKSTQLNVQAAIELMLREQNVDLGDPALLLSCRADLLVRTLNGR